MIFASAALAVVTIDVSDLLEEFRVFPDVFEVEIIGGNIAGGGFEESANLHFANVGNEGEAFAAHAAADILMWVSLGGAVVDGFALADDALVVGGAGDAELHFSLAALVAEPLQDVFIFFRRDFLVGKFLAASGGHEQERVEGNRAELFSQGHHSGQFVEVVFGDGGVNLERQIIFAGDSTGLQGDIESAFNLAKAVV